MRLGRGHERGFGGVHVGGMRLERGGTWRQRAAGPSTRAAPCGPHGSRRDGAAWRVRNVPRTPRALPRQIRSSKAKLRSLREQGLSSGAALKVLAAASAPKGSKKKKKATQGGGGAGAGGLFAGDGTGRPAGAGPKGEGARGGGGSKAREEGKRGDRAGMSKQELHRVKRGGVGKGAFKSKKKFKRKK